MKSRVQSVEASYFVHATEDPGKIWGAVSRLLGSDAAPEVESLEGHFGNSIAMVRVRAVGPDAESALKRVFASMPEETRREVAESLGTLVDEHSALFLRFDKQLLLQGRLALGSGDPVRVKVKPRLFQVGPRTAGLYMRLLEESRAAQ